MSIDSVQKRRYATTLLPIHKVPLPDGDINWPDRANISWVYLLYDVLAGVYISNTKVVLKRDTLSIEKRIEERSVADFVVVDIAGTSHYYKGQPVVIYDNDGTLIFGGIVDSSREKRMSPEDVGLYHHIKCTDNSYFADKRIAAEAYTSTLAGDIVDDLMTKYLIPEGISEGDIQDGVLLEQVVINYAKVSEALNALAERSNFIWYIDEGKELFFVSRATFPAPRTVDGDEITKKSAELIRSSPLYRNRQYIQGGKAETSLQTETFTGDGDTKAFAVGFPVVKVPTVTEDGGAPMTVGIKGLDTGKDYYWNKGDEVVTAEVAPVGAVVIVIAYYGEYDIIGLAENAIGIADRKAIEGSGTGYVDDITTAPDLTTLDAILEAAGEKCQYYATLGSTFNFETETSGLKPGQLLTVDYPMSELNDAEMLIVSVIIRLEDRTFKYSVSAIIGPSIGSWSKFFGSLITGIAKVDFVRVGSGTILILMVRADEEWEWSEAVVETVFTCPLCGLTTYPTLTTYPC